MIIITVNLVAPALKNEYLCNMNCQMYFKLSRYNTVKLKYMYQSNVLVISILN